MAQVKIKLDVWNDAALKNIEITNQKLIQLQVNGKSITVGNNKQVQAETAQVKKLDAQIKNVQKTSENAGNTATRALQKNQQQAKGLTREFKQVARGVNDLIHSFINPMTIVLVTFEALTKVATYFWNNLSENIDKATSRSNGAIKTIERHIKQSEERTKKTIDLIRQLEQLNELDSLNNEQQRLGQTIIARLNKQYDDLGITLDETTGKFKNLYKAQLIVNEEFKKEQTRGLRGQLTAQKTNIDAALKKAFGSGISTGSEINGNDLFTIAERVGQTLGAQNAQLLARKWGSGTDLKAMRDVVYELQQGLSQGSNVTLLQEVIDAFDVAIDYTNQLKELNSVDTLIIESEKRLTEAFKAQKDAIKSAREEIDNLSKSLEDQQRANSLAALDPEDRANALRAEVEQLEKRNEALEETKKLRQSQYDKTMSDSFSDPIRYEGLEDSLKQSQDKIQNLQDEYDKLVEKRSRLNNWFTERERLMLEPEELKESFEVEKKLVELTEKIAEKSKELTSQQNNLISLKKEYNEAEINMQSSSEKLLQIEQSITELEKQRAENSASILTKEQQITQIEVKLAQEKADAELKAWQLEQQRIQSYSDLVNDLMKKEVEGLNEILGKKKDNLLLELQLNAEKTRGRKLTQEQINALRSYVDVMTMQDQFRAKEKLNIQNNGVISNDIARKGGWASSVVVDRAQDINKQILNVQRSQVELMHKLNETMDRSNELLKQFSVIQ